MRKRKLEKTDSSANKSDVYVAFLDAGLTKANVKIGDAVHLVDINELRNSSPKHIYLHAHHHARVRWLDPFGASITEPVTAVPPRLVEFFLTAILDQKKADAILGDLTERFQRDLAELGNSSARTRYWGRAVHSMLPLLRRALARLMKWGAVVDFVHRHF